nr:hypothetical protein [Tanacetum cinerariifolium]
MWNPFMTDIVTLIMHNLHTQKGATIYQLRLEEGARKVAVKLGKCKDVTYKIQRLEGFKIDESDVWEEADGSAEL